METKPKTLLVALISLCTLILAFTTEVIKFVRETKTPRVSQAITLASAEKKAVPFVEITSPPNHAPQLVEDTQKEEITLSSQFVELQSDLFEPSTPKQLLKIKSGAEYVSELSVSEFIQQVEKNVILIDSYLIKIKGGSEIEVTANYYNMKAVVEFSEFLEANIDNLQSYVSDNSTLQRGLYHAYNAEGYRQIFNNM